MFNKPQKSTSLLIFEVLSKRMVLTKEQAINFHRLHRGHIGEMKFYEQFQKEFRNLCISLYSLNLKIGNSECQIDHLLLFQHEIIPLEIKYFPGDYYYHDNRYFIATTNKEINNPILQINRTNSLLRDFLTLHHSPLTVRSFCLFVHPEFHLYNAPQDPSLIFPGQTGRFIQNLHHIPYQYNAHHQYIVGKLKEAHVLRSANEILPAYNYMQLKKGIVCKECKGFMEMIGKKLTCPLCSRVEKTEDAIVRNIKEFHLLFPGEKITVTSSLNWCNGVISKQRMKEILTANFQLVNKGRYAYYEFSD